MAGRKPVTKLSGSRVGIRSVRVSVLKGFLHKSRQPTMHPTPTWPACRARRECTPRITAQTTTQGERAAIGLVGLGPDLLGQPDMEASITAGIGLGAIKTEPMLPCSQQGLIQIDRGQRRSGFLLRTDPCALGSGSAGKRSDFLLD